MGTDPGLPATAIFNFNQYLKIFMFLLMLLIFLRTLKNKRKLSNFDSCLFDLRSIPSLRYMKYYFYF